MPTLAIGNRDQAGFTLIEMLAVLTILALATSVVMLAVPSGRPSPLHEAEQAAARFALARDEAVARARPISLQFNQGGYAIGQETARQWTWSPGLSVLSSAPQIVFDATGFSEQEVTVTLREGSQAATIRINSDGAIRVGP
jgi:general secretion pathway protein H